VINGGHRSTKDESINGRNDQVINERLIDQWQKRPSDQ